MDAFRPNPSTLLRAVEREVQRRRNLALKPRVLWQLLTESPDDFDHRVADIRAQLTAQTVLIALQSGRRTRAPIAGVTHAQLPAKLFTLLHPSTPTRYRVATGGRGSAKSWSFATVLVLRALVASVRVLCVREIQLSIRQSVHRLLTDRIDALGLGAHFEVKEHSIRSRAGGEFIFEGLFSNISKIKSLEGVDLVWVEEAESVSERSLETLIPTIREPASEIWLTMNPDDVRASAHRRFIANPPPTCRHVHVVLDDNPWLPIELRREAQYLATVDDDSYRHIWLGEPRQHSAAQVFLGKYVCEEFTASTAWDGPYQGCDFGFAVDPTVLLRCWVHERTLYIEHEAYGHGVDLDRLPAMFDAIPRAREYNTRADSSRPETVSFLRGHGFDNFVGVEKWAGSVADGISHVRSYERVVIHPRCPHTLDEFRLYSYKVDRLSGDILPDLKLGSDHCIDALRYALQPLIAAKTPGFLGWLAQENVAVAANAVALRNRPGVVIRDLTNAWHK